MSTLVWSPLDAMLIIVSKSLTPVRRFESPIKVPPPIIVPATRSNESKFEILMIETPEPMDTRMTS